jgi:hypothetical protein
MDNIMQAQDAQMRALQQRAMMLAARQRELDAIEARMERANPMERAARAAPPMFVISSMKQAPSKPTVEMLPSEEEEEDERSVALSEALSSTEATQHLSDAPSESGVDTESQASSTHRRRKSYTRKSKNKLRV